MMSDTCDEKHDREDEDSESRTPNAMKFRFPEEEPPPTDINRVLKWRGDPFETYSDWTIQIITTKVSGEEEIVPEERACHVENQEPPETTNTGIYHVHKYILACGTRRSGYFGNLFQNRTFREAESQTSKLELDPLAALAFPDLLDYLYGIDKPLKITMETATALYYLGEYLDIRHLRWDVIQFVKKNMSLSNVGTYYSHAMVFQCDAILGILAKFLGENIQKIDPKSNILLVSDSRLWINALEFSPMTDITSAHISTLITTFAENKGDTLDLETLHELTLARDIPVVASNSALAMCALEDKLEGKKTAGKNIESKALSSLQERCASSLSRVWKSFAVPDETTHGLLRDRKPSFLVDLLLKSLQNATSQLESARAKFAQSESNLSTARSSLAATKRELSRSQNAMTRQTEEAMNLKVELQKFKPLVSDRGTFVTMTKVPLHLQQPDQPKSTMTYQIYSSSPPGAHPVFLYHK